MAFGISDVRRKLEATKYQVAIDETTGATDDESLTRRGLAYWKLSETHSKRREFEAAARYSRQAALTCAEVPSLRAIGVHALARQGGALVLLERYDEALVPLDEVVECLPIAPHLLDTLVPELRSLKLLDAVAKAAGLRVYALQQLGRMDEADAAAEFAINAFQSGETAPQRLTAADALVVRARYAHQRGDLDRALASIDEAITRTGKDAEFPGFSQVRSVALAERGKILQGTGSTDNAR
jgi:tetratricopeptide (TPR) repeat protein